MIVNYESSVELALDGIREAGRAYIAATFKLMSDLSKTDSKTFTMEEVARILNSVNSAIPFLLDVERVCDSQEKHARNRWNGISDENEEDEEGAEPWR